VLAPEYRHYAPELRMVSAASMRIMEKLEREHLRAELPAGKSEMPEDVMPGDLVPEDMGRQIRILRPLLTAMAGPRVSLTIE
jgi:hypothetical protein